MTWEYAICEVRNHLEFVSEANKLGVDGWEVVQIESRWDHQLIIGYFKRQKPE